MTDYTDWIGKTARAEESVSPWTANAMHAALDCPDNALGAGDALPPGWHWTMFAEVKPTASLGRDGHPARGDFLPPVALPRRMWGGGRFQYQRPITIGTPVIRTSTIKSVSEKSGKSGPLCFVTVAHDLADANGTCFTEEHDIVYREDPAPDAPPPSPPDAPTDADLTRTVNAGAVMLFRYSALTFNGHRIHYDRDYCRDVEGYPGLIVHGPLIATFLMQLAGEMTDEPIKSFGFRAVSSLFDTAPFTINAKRSGNQISAWATNPAGGLAMSATAETE